MVKSDYDDFYNKVIKECIDVILKDAGQAGCSFSGKKCQYRIYQYYQEKRDFVKNKYLRIAEDAALDRHKVASCMMYAILKANPVRVNRYVEKLPEKVLLANEYLAVFTAINIIEMYRRDQFGESIDCEIILPKTYHEDEEGASDFLSNMCKALYYTKLQGIERFDLFAYSSILFLLEKYTDTINVLQ